MPSVSKQQQKFMGIVRAIQKGDVPASKFSKSARDAAKDMSKSDVKKFAKTKHKGLPKKVKQELLDRLKKEYAFYHTGVTSRKRKHDDDNNLGRKKKHSGQPDLEEGLISPKRGHQYFQLTKNTPVKYVAGHSGLGLNTPGVLLKNIPGFIDGKKGAYLIDYHGALFYVDLRKKVAVSLGYDLSKQPKLRYKSNFIEVPKAPEFSDWKRYLKKESVKENKIDKAELILPRGKKVYLQAEEKDYQRGLIVELTTEGGYKLNYWYGEDAKIYPAEILVDGVMVKKDGREVHIKFHPELKKGEPLGEKLDLDMLRPHQKSMLATLFNQFGKRRGYTAQNIGKKASEQEIKDILKRSKPFIKKTSSQYKQEFRDLLHALKGFREGVKMSLNRGKKIQDVSNDVWWQNYHRLLIWMNVGADVKNGLFSIMGARLGCYKVLGTDWDYNNTRDFEYLNKLWKDEYQGDIRYGLKGKRLLEHKSKIQKIKPHEVYHLGAQSYVDYSFEDEFSTFSMNINGTHYMLSAVKEFAKTKVNKNVKNRNLTIFATSCFLLANS